MANEYTLGPRLASAVPYLSGGRVIDVGTDHAHLPICLVKNGLCTAALACDVNRGPIESARLHIREAGLSDRIRTMQTDGLHGTEDFLADDVMIFGMGGELILRILEEAPWVRDGRVGLILQPMSRASLLRAWLLQNGFAITGESLSFEGRYYQTLAARYCGTVQADYSAEELLLGRINIERRPPLFEGFLRHEIGVYENIVSGKARAGQAEGSEEARLLQILQGRLESIT